MSRMSAALPLPSGLDDHIRPLLRHDYEQLVDSGAFDDEPIELLEGFLVEMSPEGAGHVYVIDKLNEILVSALLGRHPPVTSRHSCVDGVPLCNGTAR